LKGSLPASVKVFTRSGFISEDRALAILIDEAAYLKDGVVVFDRGLQQRDAFDHFTSSGKGFIGRSRTNIYFHGKCKRALPLAPAEASVEVYSDEEGWLCKRRGKRTQHTYRLIKAKLKKNGEELWLIANLMQEEAYTVAQWYYHRWDIEVFFSFIKQHLSAAHLVSRSENGIRVMVYMTLIVAVLVLAYKKLNSISSYKMARLRFEIELENDIIKSIVQLCGGDPKKALHLFNSS
jgi:IS4 transposase